MGSDIANTDFSLSNMDCRDEEMTFAAECLLAMSRPVVHGPFSASPSPVKEINNNVRTPPRGGDDPLFMIARILTDLNSHKQQDPEAPPAPDASQNHKSYNHKHIDWLD